MAPSHSGTVGLSPLARGTHVANRLIIIYFRFIPAGAGNTIEIVFGIYSEAVYPRWRGEHGFYVNPAILWCGLSPLARGTPDGASQSPFLSRFIPAGAGNTLATGHPIFRGAVYPRWRGEHSYIWKQYYNICGLSPLARGTHSQDTKAKATPRFIPAGAGNTYSACLRTRSTPVYPRWRGEHSKHNLLLINDFLSQSQSTNFIVSHKQHIHYVKEHLIH